jgi:hypothetical protein
MRTVQCKYVPLLLLVIVIIYNVILSGVFFIHAVTFVFYYVLIQTFTNPDYSSPQIVRINKVLLYVPFHSCNQPDDDHVWFIHVTDLQNKYTVVFSLYLSVLLIAQHEDELS